MKDLTLKDSFMFGAVMLDPENCKGLLKLILDVEIDRVDVNREKSIVYHPEYKGVRLDVYAKDEKETHYDVEIQIKKTAVEKRSRYYHSQMDMESLLSGADYEKLPDSFVIFICDYDPFGYEKYKYTIHNTCEEIPEYPYKDGIYTIILNTHGENEDEVPKSLVDFLKYLGADSNDEKEYQDEYVAQLQQSVRTIKSSRAMEEKFMLFEEMLQEREAIGKEIGKQTQLLILVRKKIRKNKTLEQIVDELEESTEIVQPLYNFIIENQDKTEEEILQLYFGDCKKFCVNYK